MLFLRLTAAAVLAAAIAAASSSAAGAVERVHLVVEFDPAATAPERAEALAGSGLELVDEVGPRFALVAGPAGALDDRGGAIVDVDRVVEVRAAATPNDPLFSQQWNLSRVQAESAWDLTTGGGAVVAVIDSGIARGAPDLAGTSILPGTDWVDGGAPDDVHGHGTHVTGTIAQRTNDGYGAAGLAHGATVLPLRVLDANGSGSDANVAAAVNHAVGQGADVINLSLGSPYTTTVLRTAIADAVAAGVVVVASAGNFDPAAGQSSAVTYPAAYPGVLAVAATNPANDRAHFSSYGSAVDLAAPGVGIWQQTIDGAGGYAHVSWSGTSMAAPHVAAAAALLVSHGATGASVPSLLTSTALDLGPAGTDEYFGAGLLQVRAALDAVAAGATAPPSGGQTLPPAESEPAPRTGVQDVEDACPARVVPRGGFTDVDPSSVHARAVDCVAWLRFASGSAPGLFAPGSPVTRAQMATFLARVLERAGVALPESPPGAFDDDAGSPHERAIDQLAALGVVRGTGARAYSPAAPVTRAAMATFLVAVHDLAAAADLPAPAGDPFADDNGSVHEGSIGRLAAAGIATGTAPGTYGPGDLVVRGQMATFLARLTDALVDAGDLPRP